MRCKIALRGKTYVVYADDIAEACRFACEEFYEETGEKASCYEARILRRIPMW